MNTTTVKPAIPTAKTSISTQRRSRFAREANSVITTVAAKSPSDSSVRAKEAMDATTSPNDFQPTAAIGASAPR